MILIDDYRNLRRYSTPNIPRAAEQYLGRSVTVTTDAGTSYSGIVIEYGADTVTLTLRRRSDRTDRRIVISKAHIVAVEMAL